MPQFQFEDNPNDLRETLQKAFEEHTKPEEDPDNKPNEQPLPDGDDSSVNNDQPIDQKPDDQPADQPADQKPEDQKPADQKPTDQKPTDQPVDKPASGPHEKAPGTWTPAAREKWSKLDPEIRAEVWKREREASRAMTVSAEARKFTGEFEKRVQPYLGFIAAEKSTPLDAMESFFRMGAVFRVGTQEQKVALVADTIRRFGVNLEMLDTVLAGQQPQFNPQATIQQAVQQAVAPLQQQFQQQQRAQQTQSEQSIEAEIDAFAADPKNEFFDDVKHLIPDILEVAAKHGQQMSLTDAYQRATLIHEPVRQVIEARQRNQALRKQAGNTALKKAAASSVTSSQQTAINNAVGSKPAAPAVDNIRADIEAAIAAQQGR